MSLRSHQKDRRDTNPALGRRKLKLGTFQTNLNSGCVMSDLDGRLELTWPNTVTLAQLADAMDFEALVPVARWRGFGGATDPQGPGFETFTWAAGIAGATKNSGVISTSHVALNHPIIAAKQSTVIDHISNGRYTLNIVNGWNYPEMEMFGVSLLEHDDRYACAEEWLAIVKRLWTEDDKFDFDGKFYRIKGGYLQPKPIQAPYPAIMNAGSSERGRHFACRHCDLVFTNIRSHDIATNTAHVAAYHKLARETYGREVKVWSNATIVQAETEQEARDFYRYYVHEKGDWVAARNVIDTMARRDQQARLSGRAKKRHGRDDDLRLGRIPADRHQGADRRWTCHVVEDRAGRRAIVLAALYRGHARIPRRDLSVAAAGGVARRTVG